MQTAEIIPGLPESGNTGQALSRAQFLMWLGQKMNPDIPLYNMIQTFEIRGPLQPERLCAAFAEVVRASDALRTVIDEIDGAPQPRLLAEISQPIQWVDLSSTPDSQAAYAAWLDQRRARLLDLRRQLFDSALLRLGEDHHIWYLCQHHLVTDGWSFELVYRRTAEVYQRLDSEGPFERLNLPAYQAYVEYEALQVGSQSGRKAAAYWEEMLRTPAGQVNFYQQSGRPKSAATERRVITLGQERTARLKALAATKDIRGFSLDLALFNLFATTFSVFVQRTSGAQPVVFGAPFHNRNTPAFKETVGLFIEIAPLRVEIEAGETYLDVYRKLARESMTALRNALPGSGSPERNRYYQTLLNFVNVTFPSFAGLPVDVDWVHPGYGDKDHSLRLQIHDFNGSGSYQLHFDFNCETFSQSLQEQAAAHFLAILDHLLADVTAPALSAPLASETERQRLVEDFNRSDLPYPAHKTVVQLFEEQAARTPQAEAVFCAGERLTYAALNEQANRLAHHLRGMGAGPERLVGICMEHSPELLVGLLGILKAGGAYVPLDPHYPPERLAFMLDDIRSGSPEAPLLVTQPGLAERFAGAAVRVVSLDPQYSVISGADSHNPPPAAGPGHLAYVIFTSGSTGKPKGAMIEHRGLTNYLWWARQAYFQGEALDFALFTSLSFDLTVTSIYTPLLSGSRVVIYPEDPGVRGMAVLKVMQDDQVDIVKLTPAHIGMIKDMDLSGSRVRKYIVGGEDFKTALARSLYAAHGKPVEIYNEYGPTETVVGCMIHRFDEASDQGLSVPVGVPAGNAQIYVLDEYLSPAPVGIPGEMYIGGHGVGRGYLNRPELSAERFLENPFRPGERLYRTGDLAVWEQGGMLKFLGRVDHQVKIGGARIELGEIEALLRSHPAIQDCVVTAVPRGARPAAPVETYCARCGLAANFPGVTFDDQGVCSLCRSYETYKDKAAQYFRSFAELEAIFEEVKARRTGDYDCVVLLSGGKDSTYMVHQVVRMGLKPLVFTLDNGYIADTAKANIRRTTATLGVDHVFGQTPAMKAIFADSLQQYANVCNGCFKTIYTLAVNLAREKGIRCIVTGLSRGQFFETRLTEDLFQAERFDPAEIDRAILEVRKNYHRREDLISHALDVDAFRDDAVFEDIQFVDFYRYCDVSLDEVYAFLDEHAVWARPEDTGRSTNCLINDAGIYVHQKRRGYHNYALPYSWDVRMGHKSRQGALEELQDEIDEARVLALLAEVGYELPAAEPEGTDMLAAYYVSSEPVTGGELRKHLAQHLPEYMLPAAFTSLERIPLTPNGKVDRRALPAPGVSRPEGSQTYTAPRSPLESLLVEIWSSVLHVEPVGVEDNFFLLGGSSLPALQIITRLNQRFNVTLPVQRFFENPTIAQLAQAVEALLLAELEEMSEDQAQELLQQGENGGSGYE